MVVKSNDDNKQLNNSTEKKAAETLAKESKIKGISFKTIFMIIMIIAIVLFLLTRALLSLKDSFSPKDQKIIDDKVVVVDDKLNIQDYRNEKQKQKQKETDLDDDEKITNDSDFKENKIIIKGRLGLANFNDSKESLSQIDNNVQKTTDDININNENKNNIVKAEILKLDPNLSIRRGTFIKCSLRTDLISQISGDIGCIINDDVYSTNGNVLLIEKGSIVNGSFRRAGVNHGDSRIFVLWEEIITPHDITINVNSGASDVLGGVGIDGFVDNHFWTRFGNAILVSLITDASSSAASRLQKEHTYNDFSNTADSGANVAKTIIERSVDIPPTIYRNHGDTVGIYISQNIDFSDVYKLEYIK